MIKKFKEFNEHALTEEEKYAWYKERQEIGADDSGDPDFPESLRKNNFQGDGGKFSFHFELEIGVFIRSGVRKELERSKEKLERLYPGSIVDIDEQKTLIGSEFRIKGRHFPSKCRNVINNWMNQIKRNCD